MTVIRVSRHAIERFQQRINALVWSGEEILAVWYNAKPATQWDLNTVFDFQSQDDESEYRVGYYRGKLVLLIAHNDTIVSCMGEKKQPTDLDLWKASHKRG